MSRAAFFQVVLVALAAAVFLGCTRDRPRPTGDKEEAPALPMVDQAFVRKALGPDAELASKPVLADLDPRPGQEALVAVNVGGNYQVAVVRGNHQVLARAPLGGRVLAHSYIKSVGELRALDPGGGMPTFYLLPVQTLVYKQWVCGLLVFRYRPDALALVGELGSRCWTRQTGDAKLDPHSLMRVVSDPPDLRIEMQDEGKRTGLYRWDEDQSAFVSMARPPGK